MNQEIIGHLLISPLFGLGALFFTVFCFSMIGKFERKAWFDFLLWFVFSLAYFGNYLINQPTN
jgi:hypothetical protein